MSQPLYSKKHQTPLGKQEKRIPVSLTGKRLDQVVAALVPLGRAEAVSLIEEGQILVNGEIMHRPSMRVTRGMLIGWPEELSTKEHLRTKPGKGQFALPPEAVVLAETDDFLVLNKPAGLSMHPVRKGQQNTLTDWLYTHYPQLRGVGELPERPGMVHRLDKDTSGIVLIAKHNQSFKALKSLFQERSIKKQYRALVYGNLKSPAGTIETPLGRIKGGIRRGGQAGNRAFSGELRPAVTQYTLHTRYPQYDLLSVEPKTGRTHQIRVHLASLGHPIVGDRLYRFKEHRKDSLIPPHQLLHAESLHFTLFGKKYHYEAPLPTYFRDSLSVLSLTKASGFPE